MGFDVVIVTADKDMLQLVRAPGPRLPHGPREVPRRGGRARVLRGLARPGRRRPRAHGRQRRTTSPASRAWARSRPRSGSRSTATSPRSSRGRTRSRARSARACGSTREDALLSRRLVEIPVDLPIPFEPATLRRSDARRREKLKGALRRARVPLARGRDPRRGRGRRREIVPAASGRTSRSRLERLRDARRRPPAREGRAPARGRGRPRTSRSPRSRPRRSLARWTRARPAGRLVRGARREAARRPARRARRQRRAADVFDVCLAQYVLSPGRRAARSSSRHGVPAARPEDRRPTRRPGSSPCALPEGYAIETADRWLAERASGRGDARAAPRARSSRRGPALEKIYREIERPLTPVLARMELAGVGDRRAVPERDVGAHGEGPARPRAEDLGGGRRGVQRELPGQARPDPLREAEVPRPARRRRRRGPRRPASRS